MYNSATKSMMWVGAIILAAGAYVLLGLFPAILVGVGSGWWVLNR